MNLQSYSQESILNIKWNECSMKSSVYFLKWKRILIFLFKIKIIWTSKLKARDVIGIWLIKYFLTLFIRVNSHAFITILLVRIMPIRNQSNRHYIVM